MFIQAFDGSQYCCVNDKDIYALEEIPEHETKSKDLDIDYTPPKPKKAFRNEPPGVVNSLENLSNSKNTTRMIKIQKLPEDEAHQYNKPQQKAGANTSIILGHFQKRLTP